MKRKAEKQEGEAESPGQQPAAAGSRTRRRLQGADGGLSVSRNISVEDPKSNICEQAGDGVWERSQQVSGGVAGGRSRPPSLVTPAQAAAKIHAFPCGWCGKDIC